MAKIKRDPRPSLCIDIHTLENPWALNLNRLEKWVQQSCLNLTPLKSLKLFGIKIVVGKIQGQQLFLIMPISVKRCARYHLQSNYH